ncbi:ATP-binding protein [Pseudonocardia sp. WMMC193]|uniref:ATP-binding protein n=1 Tax=Pseudonocardia sp. WMMC193 TaxID=2911965 RepID=UPI001F42ABE1|nr:ATP-binding protein [Pseudonocardia sp. WMMC193]MCF7548843.1 ATP-binding protein [Pseudonocardia sp. WMMC193]
MNVQGLTGGGTRPTGTPVSADTADPTDSAAEELRVVRTATPDALAGIRAVVSTWARGVGLSADGLVDLLLAVGEAAANVVDHAYRGGPPGPVEVELGLRADRAGRVVTARISDRGRWRPSLADAGDRGRGLPMIRALAQYLDVAATPTGTQVCLELAVS